MKVNVDHALVFKLLDTLLPRWKAVPKQYPYNHKDAIIPQTIVPADLRADKETLASFYFFACTVAIHGKRNLFSNRKLPCIINE